MGLVATANNKSQLPPAARKDQVSETLGRSGKPGKELIDCELQARHGDSDDPSDDQNEADKG
jgi:hypothetical protein